MTNATAGIRLARHDPLTLRSRDGPGQRPEEDFDMTNTTDNSFPYVLVCSTFGTIISLASVWIATAQSFATVLVA